MSITEPNTVHYLREIADLKNGEALRELEEYARLRLIPIIRKEAAEVLRFFIRTEKPRRILEIGTAMGYSAILMAGEDQGIQVDSIERAPHMVALARANIARFGLEERVRVLEGDAGEILRQLSGEYDLIFMDAGKSHYQDYLSSCLELIASGGMILCDNILVRGLVAREGVVRKHSTAIWSMRRFIENVSLDGRFHSLLLPVGDGLLIIKLKE